MSGGGPSAIAAQPQPLRTHHTPSFTSVLESLGASLLVTNYQSGLIAVIRAEAERLHVVASTVRGPMGMALNEGKLAIGSTTQIFMFQDVLSGRRRVPSPGRPDAVFLPRWSSTTGNIYVHELAWAANELWIVNARFSCLCTIDQTYSFLPRWRPPFVSALMPDDRCHLNGLCVIDGRPRFVTAHGQSDEPGGWRARKADGGVVIDVERGEIVLDRLSMPHSPRWHDGRLWLLDSGRGSIGFLDPATGRYERVAELPGFTRGLQFAGRYAFVGLSQARQTSAFSGIPVEALAERICGVWVVDIETGNTVATLRFGPPIAEVFDLQLLPTTRFPEIVVEDRRIVDSFILPKDELTNTPARWRTEPGAEPGPRPGAAGASPPIGP